MSQEVEVYQFCHNCRGTGTYVGGPVNPVSITCTYCGGDGQRTLGHITLDPSLSDILGKLNDLIEKVDEIKAIVDAL